ncbi:type II toxin-antitoxin system RelE/ParE family toxin [Nonomuraea sp. MCN248]|uniref:Type II toxin-antitoxin system RelE/ParE family toxin n=1 Tax=Nonomuraea corallina TaxID=2989783 RepID=A0ABT4S6Z0_9ACTN|nr:type II toxin-antitoxin system RelE/ParE family toxin [Nonomuraea corallina]MDA0632971.1 type II toxin-antitoxin system RelE/ParE family toxin [Nonomuraea corallina]
MAWEITLHIEVNAWFMDVCKNDPIAAEKIEEALDELALQGPKLGRPLVDRIHHSRVLHNLKELRPRVPGEAEIRMLFVFDPTREAIVLVAGDKSGAWNRWYRTAIPLAEERYAAYRAEKEEEQR